MIAIGKTLSLALISLLLFGIGYPVVMTGLAHLLNAQAADGKPIFRNDTLVGFENVGQAFSSSSYFWGRPSAVNYDASAPGASNLAPSNPEFRHLVQQRIDTLKKYHPGLSEKNIPVELITASGSGLDPHISSLGALIQVNRIALNRNLSPVQLSQLIKAQLERPLFGLFGPGDYINVLKLNLALDDLTHQQKKEQQ